ncbi:MAG TPA: transcription-repair coupling factor [Steroidobacteraceae bacterium]|jgi:transcription-repair coupling factor (superfamily II helicase)|nr:transcription-repair coupling factor [Steroidobacteraceae bacterium]
MPASTAAIPATVPANDTLFSPPLPAADLPFSRWRGLHGSARALALAEAVGRDTRPWVLIAADARDLERLGDELRFFGGPDLAILTLPDWEVLPYDIFSPHPDIVSQRLRTLSQLPSLTRGALLLTAESLLTRLPPVAYVQARSFELKTGTALAIEPLRARLVESGYASVSQVSAPGEFALRGSLFDVYPMGSDAPVRVDLLDDEIDSIRSFDPDTQRSGGSIEQLRLLPAREMPLDAEAVKGFRRRYRSRFEGDVTRMPIYRGVSEGLAPPGIEFYLPLFFDGTAQIAEYLPREVVIASDIDLDQALERAWESIGARYEDRRHDIERPLLPPAEVFVAPDAVHEAIGRHPQVAIERFAGSDLEHDPAVYEFHSTAPPDFRLDARAAQPLAPLTSFLESYPGRVLIAADSPGRREVIAEMLGAHGRRPRALQGWPQFAGGDARLAICVAEDVGALSLDTPPLLLLGEAQLFGTRARQERRRRRSTPSDPAAILRDLQSLEPGAPVVHDTYGVGRYVGLQLMEIGDQSGEFLTLEYRDGDRVYVPVHALHLVNRYTGGAPETAPLHKLGTDQWAKARKKAAESVRDVAAELLDLHARRAAHQASSLHAGELEYQTFANGFPFEETADQGEAIRQVLRDMQATTPMDRVVCGDVGFGKTEVAMRAAFVAVQAGRQVAVLVPTTLLAQQHTQSFRDRFADWPVRIESLSRFRSSGETSTVIEGLERGTVDIVIATHRLLHAGARFKNLGLIVVDEEHRFGVRDKERLKTLRAEVHVLTLTATPIPRTLNMALGGLRELSLITTPPAARLAIKTFITEWHPATLREATLRELRRGGQVYLVHNEVQGIEKIAAEFAALVPEATVRIGHGQMRERELEQLMVDFYHRRFDVLVCTTIIESGIDVPSANTILINRADRLGLAQLHQLRGRVGRSHHRAYAYLVVPSRKALTGDAAKRLEAIEKLEDLGAGFALATHDLEIRGAGEFLGESQSGQLSEVGLSMYLDMLEQAVTAMRENREPALDRPLAATSEIELHVPALLPESYVPDVHLRLALYQRIAGADAPTLNDMTAELIDRFGTLPDVAHNLLRLAHLRITARALGVRRLDLTTGGGNVQFEEHNRADPALVIKLIQRHAKEFRLEGPLKLRITRSLPKAEQRFEYAQQVLARLAGDSPAPTPVRS